MSARVAVMIYPGTNSEAETLRVLRAVGLDAQLVHWSRADDLPSYDAYVLCGGFAYEDRVRAGAIAAHDRMTDHLIEGALAGKLVLGLCNGAQILLEAGLVPGTGEIRRPTAAFTKNSPTGKFICRHVNLKLTIDPARCAITSGLPAGCLVPAWVAHAEGRLAATDDRLQEIIDGRHLAFVYAHRDGSVDDDAVPNGSELGAAALTNIAGNVLAIMPHPERDAFTFNHPDAPSGRAARRDREAVLRPSGGVTLFESFAYGLTQS